METFRLRGCLGLPRIVGRDCAAEGYEAKPLGDLWGYPRLVDLGTRMQILVRAAQRARGYALECVFMVRFIDHCAHCLRALAALRGDAEEKAPGVCRQAPGFAHLAERTRQALGTGIRVRLRANVHSRTLHEVAQVEASNMPEGHKAAKKANARRLQGQDRLRRRSVSVDTMYGPDGAMIADTTAIGKGILRHRQWQPVFAQSAIDRAVQGDFDVVPQTFVQEWWWAGGVERGDWGASAMRRQVRMGYPTPFGGRRRVHGRPSWTMSARLWPPARAHPLGCCAVARCAFPSADLMGDVHAAARRGSKLLLITLMNTIANIVARQVNKPVSAMVARSVTIATPQRGIVCGRRVEAKYLSSKVRCPSSVILATLLRCCCSISRRLSPTVAKSSCVLFSNA